MYKLTRSQLEVQIRCVLRELLRPEGPDFVTKLVEEINTEDHVLPGGHIDVITCIALTVESA